MRKVPFLNDSCRGEIQNHADLGPAYVGFGWWQAGITEHGDLSLLSLLLPQYGQVDTITSDIDRSPSSADPHLSVLSACSV